ncbi:retrovirus-related pol polyprotein from transposon TNT 1-94 [Tanacetum coccineum]|uniref:Retrovirus-related pol polyprotein from transposon TNT 1-94 n=1 Tax=Tanacetum coccineum TaxID=301880 RepID=A0ABQ5CAC1_9ASTR
MPASSPICLMSKATSTKSWLWHRRLSYMNFGTINHLTKQHLVDELPKCKYKKDHLCSACKRGKSNKATLSPKLVPSTHSKLELINMDIDGPIRVESINGKKYILVIVDDYSRYTWVYFLETKDEAPEMIKKFIAQKYFEKRSPEVSINSVAQPTPNNDDTPSSSSIIVKDQEATPFVSYSEEKLSLISSDDVVESVQEDSADFDGNNLFTPYDALTFKEAESSSIATDPSNMHEFNQV